MTDTVLETVRVHLPELTAIRRDIHAHPEMGLEEVRTAALVATNLKDSSDDEMEDRAARAMARAALSTTRAQGANNS